MGRDDLQTERIVADDYDLYFFLKHINIDHMLHYYDILHN